MEDVETDRLKLELAWKVPSTCGRSAWRAVYTADFLSDFCDTAFRIFRITFMYVECMRLVSRADHEVRFLRLIPHTSA